MNEFKKQLSKYIPKEHKIILNKTKVGYRLYIKNIDDDELIIIYPVMRIDCNINVEEEIEWILESIEYIYDSGTYKQGIKEDLKYMVEKIKKVKDSKKA